MADPRHCLLGIPRQLRTTFQLKDSYDERIATKYQVGRSLGEQDLQDVHRELARNVFTNVARCTDKDTNTAWQYVTTRAGHPAIRRSTRAHASKKVTAETSAGLSRCVLLTILDVFIEFCLVWPTLHLSNPTRLRAGEL